MNTIEFLIEGHLNEFDREYSTIDLIIDGKSLSKIIREYELPFAEAEGSPELAGRYSSLCDDDYYGFTAHFLGKYKSWYGSGNKTVLYECECRIEYCWPLICEIKITEQQVIWTNFEQIHRAKDSAGSFWDYSNFKGFVFDKNQYLQALSIAEKKLAELNEMYNKRDYNPFKYPPEW